MKPTPTQDLNASLKGKIIGFNNHSGKLYLTQNGLLQFKPPKNVVPPPVNYSKYTNKMNTDQTLEEMNSKKGSPPDFYKGNSETLKVIPEAQPGPFTIKGGQSQ